MKRKITMTLAALLCCFMLAGCSNGATTMDQGRDTDGIAGEAPPETDRAHNATSGENGEGAQESTENITGGAENAVNNAKKATEDVAGGAGQAAKDVVDGATDAVKDAADGAKNAAEDVTGQKNK